MLVGRAEEDKIKRNVKTENKKKNKKPTPNECWSAVKKKRMAQPVPCNLTMQGLVQGLGSVCVYMSYIRIYVYTYIHKYIHTYIRNDVLKYSSSTA